MARPLEGNVGGSTRAEIEMLLSDDLMYQVGTLTETYQAMLTARVAGMGMVVSARSGETEDTAIVHLATGWNTGQLKVGSFARSERMAKWNEAVRIESSAAFTGEFAGTQGLAPVGSRKMSG